MYVRPVRPDELYHYGVLGMKWGVRRYQNYDGTRIGTGGKPVINNSKQAKAAFKRSVAGGQGGKATGNARYAAKAPSPTAVTLSKMGKSAANTKEGNSSAKEKFDKLTKPTVKQGKGREDISPAEKITKDVKTGTEAGKRLVEVGEKHSDKRRKEEASERQMQKAKQMSDKELRERINRIKMEREYTSLTTEHTESGWTKAKEVLDVVGDVAVTVGAIVGIYVQLKKAGIIHSDISLDEFQNEIDDDTLMHLMELDTPEEMGDYLEHHGVLGMKWGVRRYQNYDGTRIGAGHGVGGGGGGSVKNVSDNFRKSIAGGQGGKAKGNARLAAKAAPTSEYEHNKQKILKDVEAYDHSSIEKARSEFNRLSNEITGDYIEAYKEMKNDDSVREQCYKDAISYVEKEYKIKRTNPLFKEILDPWTMEEAVNYAVDKNLPKKVLDKRDKMFKAGDQFFSESEKMSNEIASKYKGLQLKDEKGAISNGEQIAKSIVEKSNNNSWESYTYRHFDDYWVNDVEERYQLVDDYSDDFMKRYGV